jgi:NAD(P)-dependent dehydrogenase (short-subunit alcohol dehydrogenase family)
MVQPTLNTEVYTAIAPENFKGQFKGKVVIVTGAARGIGQHIAQAFAKAGATLALLDFDVPSLEETKKSCEELGSKVATYACDVTKYDVCRRTVEDITEKFGEIDVLVNNAGGGPICGFVTQKFEEFWAGVEQNFKGVFSSITILIQAMIMMHLVLPLMKKRGFGCIINIASRFQARESELIEEREL